MKLFVELVTIALSLVVLREQRRPILNMVQLTLAPPPLPGGARIFPGAPDDCRQPDPPEITRDSLWAYRDLFAGPDDPS